MKISDEALDCLGAIVLFLLILLGNGVLFWLIGKLIIYAFYINYDYTYFQAFCIGIVWGTLKIITVGVKK